MDILFQALRHALRGLSRHPGFTLVVVFTLALGIGATTAIFTVLNSVVLKPLSYADAERLVRIENRVPGVDPERNWGLSPAGYFHFRDNSRSLEKIGVYVTSEVSITGNAGPAERIQVAYASADLLDLLGIRPALGRLITAEDNRTRANATGTLPGPAVPVAVLGHEIWMRRFGADPGVIGSTIEISGTSMPVVGVLEKGADLPDPGLDVDVWLPLGLNPAAPPVNWHSFQAIGRLEEGVSLARAQSELAGFTRRFVELFPSAYPASFMETTGFAVAVSSLRDHVVGNVSGALWVLLAAVGLVLLIACANVANLFLVRAEGRAREMAIRAALGATRRRLGGHFLAEGLLLALLGGAFGLLMAFAGTRGLVLLAPEGLPRLDEIAMGWRVGGFALLVSILVGLLVGSFPLLRFASISASSAMREEGRGATAARGRNVTRNALVVGQVAMALVLLTAAGLLFRSFHELRSVAPGLDAANVLALELALPDASYRSYSEVSAYYEQLTRQIEALPGVRDAGVVDDMPFVSTGTCAALAVENPAATPAQEPGCVFTSMASPGYFETLGIPVRGKAPTWDDINRRSGGVVVSRALADRLWPGEDPIGKGIRGNGSTPPFYRVVGVAGDVRANGLDEPPTEVVYFPLIPLEHADLWGPPRSTTLVVRTATRQPELLAAPVRRIIAGLDPDVPVAAAGSVARLVAASMSRTSYAMLLLGIAAAIALALGAVGLYGVLSYVVGQRLKEIGIRMALGAKPARVARLVIFRALALAAAGIAMGLLATLAVMRVLRSVLFGISPTDPVTLAAVSLILAAVALMAGYVPARRATRVDPAGALRHE